MGHHSELATHGPAAEVAGRWSGAARLPGVATILLAPGHRVLALIAIVLAGLFCLCFGSTLHSLVVRWSTDANYGHGFLVPFVSIHLYFQQPRQKLFSTRGGATPGGALMILGLVARSATILVPSLFVQCLSMLCVLAGLIWMVGGNEGWRRLWRSWLFLFFMIPWPSAAHSRVAFPLQLMVSRAAAAGLEILGVPVLRDGNLLHLPGQTMHVAEACSGIRQLTAFLAIATAAAMILNRPAWIRALVFVSSAPIAIAVNILRVLLTALAASMGFAEWTDGSLHAIEGLLMIMAGIGLLLCELRLIDWILSEPHGHPSRSITS